MGIITFLSVCLSYCGRKYSCRSLLYVGWIVFSILSVLLFLLGAALLLASFVTYDACGTYQYYTTTPNSFVNLTVYNSSDPLKILNSCFFTNQTGNVFQAYDLSNANVQSLTTINNLYYQANPSPYFSTVVTIIEGYLNTLMLNPSISRLIGQNANNSNSPAAALIEANNQANMTASNNSCKAVQDVFQFDPTLCYPYDQNQVKNC